MASEIETKHGDIESKDLTDTTVAVELSNEVQKTRDLDVNTERDDVAAGFIKTIVDRADAHELLADGTPQEIKAVRRKADFIVVPLLQFALMMGSVDKVALGSASVMGLRTDLKLVGQQYSWTSSVIFFGAIGMIIPSLYLMQRLPANYYISTMVCFWGVVTMGMAACQNYADLIGTRFLLGCFESVIFAGFGLIISMWYTREEQPLRTAIVFSVMSSLMNGLLATACVNYHGHLAQWRLLFIIIGAITFGWSMLMFALLPANPTSAKWLTLRQRVIATRRMATARTGVENKHFKVKQAWEALYDPKTWLVFFINAALNIPNNGLGTFQFIIVNSLGFTVEQTTLLGIPTGVFATGSSIIFGYIAVKTRQRCLTGMGACIIPFIGTILMYKIPRTNLGGSLISLYLTYCFWGAYIVMMGSLYANTAGYTKKMIAYAIAYIGYCVGNIIGPQTFRANQAPKYTGGVVAMLVCYALALVLILVYRTYLVYLNKRKAQQLAAYDADGHQYDGVLEEFRDQTDFENPRFVYEF